MMDIAPRKEVLSLGKKTRIDEVRQRGKQFQGISGKGRYDA
jgi:hypothetical protein